MGTGKEATVAVDNAPGVSLDFVSGNRMRKARILPALLLIFALGAQVFGCQEEPQPLPEYARKGNPRISSQLNDLILAEERGEAALFARQNNIELEDERVRVIVEAAPGQLDAAADAARRLGTVETSYDSLLQVMVPVASLERLAGEPSIDFIRLPLEAMPGTSSRKTE